MAITILLSEWDDSGWDQPGGGGPSILVGDSFTTTSIESGNQVVRLSPTVSAYTSQVKATRWDDSSIWSGAVVFPIAVGQVFTVTSLDLSNRIVYLSG